EATEDIDRLRREANVAHHRDARLGQRAYARRHAHPALQLDRLWAGLLHEADRLAHRLLWADLEGAEGHIRDDQRSFGAAHHRAGRVDDIVHCDRQCGVIPQHYHAQGVANEEQGDARFIEDMGHRIVIGGEHGNALAASLHLPDLVWGYARHKKPPSTRGPE